MDNTPQVKSFGFKEFLFILPGLFAGMAVFGAIGNILLYNNNGEEDAGAALGIGLISFAAVLLGFMQLLFFGIRFMTISKFRDWAFFALGIVALATLWFAFGSAVILIIGAALLFIESLRKSDSLFFHSNKSTERIYKFVFYFSLVSFVLMYEIIGLGAPISGILLNSL